MKKKANGVSKRPEKSRLFKLHTYWLRIVSGVPFGVSISRLRLSTFTATDFCIVDNFILGEELLPTFQICVKLQNQKIYIYIIRIIAAP